MLLKKIAGGIGQLFGVVKCSYENYKAEKKQLEKLAVEVRNRRRVQRKYEIVAFEVNETISAVTNVIQYIKDTPPCDNLLPFNRSDYYYRISKFEPDSEDDEQLIRTFVDTLNSIALERYNRGLSPFNKPLYFYAKDKIDHIVIKACLVIERTQGLPKRYTSIGRYIGIIAYDPENKIYFIATGQRRYLVVGVRFQLLDKNNVWQETFVIWYENTWMLHGFGIPISAVCGYMVRIV
jgi:hypothetical protein